MASWPSAPHSAEETLQRMKEVKECHRPSFDGGYFEDVDRGFIIFANWRIIKQLPPDSEVDAFVDGTFSITPTHFEQVCVTYFFFFFF